MCWVASVLARLFDTCKCQHPGKKRQGMGVAHLKLEGASRAQVWATKLDSATQTTFYILLTPHHHVNHGFTAFWVVLPFQPCLANFRMILTKRWSQSKRYQTLGAMEGPGMHIYKIFVCVTIPDCIPQVFPYIIPTSTWCTQNASTKLVDHVENDHAKKIEKLW